MRQYLFSTLSILVLSVAIASPAQATPHSVPSAIDRFVAKIFPKAKHYHWVVNNSLKENEQEMIVDINTFVTNEGQEDAAPIENRFLLLVLNGEVFAAQKIPLNSNVDCGKEETEI